MKTFLDGLAYFLMRSDTEGIVTDYKDILNGKREVPVSSCPRSVEYTLYGNGAPSEDEDESGFEILLENLDRKAERMERRRAAQKKKPKRVSRIARSEQIRNELGACEFFFPVVDTDNEFELFGNRYHISLQVEQYGAKQTREGELYDMDHIACAVKSGNVVAFFDADLNRISDELIERVS